MNFHNLLKSMLCVTGVSAALAATPAMADQPRTATSYVYCTLYIQGNYGKNWQFYVTPVARLTVGIGELYPGSSSSPVDKAWMSYVRQGGFYSGKEGENYPQCFGNSSMAGAVGNRSKDLGEVKSSNSYTIRELSYNPRN